MQFQLLNPPPHDACFIPWSSVVLPLGIPGGACTRGYQRVPVSWFGLLGNSLGAVPQPRLHPCQVFIAGILGEAQMCVCSPFSSRDSTDLKGQLQHESLGFSDRSFQCMQLRCKAKNGNQLLIAYGKIQRPRPSCAEARTQIYYQQASPSGKTLGCTPGTTPEYLLLLQMRKMQKPSVSQGLYPILLLALLALTTSAYTSLGVSQDSNLQPQLLKVSVYHSATSAVYSLPMSGNSQEKSVSK